jgi:hypothetical protein
MASSLPKGFPSVSAATYLSRASRKSMIHSPRRARRACRLRACGRVRGDELVGFGNQASTWTGPSSTCPLIFTFSPLSLCSSYPATDPLLLLPCFGLSGRTVPIVPWSKSRFNPTILELMHRSMADLNFPLPFARYPSRYGPFSNPNSKYLMRRWRYAIPTPLLKAFNSGTTVSSAHVYYQKSNVRVKRYPIQAPIIR